MDEVLDEEEEQELAEDEDYAEEEPVDDATCIYWCDLLHVYFSDFC